VHNHRAARYQLLHKAAGVAIATPTALSYVGVSLSDNGFGSTKDVNVPAGIADGDMMLLAIVQAAAATVTLPSGWVEVDNQDGGGTDGITVAKRIASSEPASYTVTYSVSLNTAAAIVAFRSAGGESIVVDASAKTDSTVSGASHNAPSVTTNDVNAMLVCCTAWSGTEPAGLTADASMTERTESASAGCMLHIMTGNQASAGATGTKSVSGVNSRTAKLISVALIEDV